MPRKKNGLPYELLPRPTKDENGQPLLYARSASYIKYSTELLDDFCHANRAMHSGELKRALQVFMEVAAIHMKNGERIITPFGSFAPKLRLDGEFTDPKKVKNKNVHFDGIEFVPSKEFANALEDQLTAGFVHVPDRVHTKPLHVLREEGTIDEALSRCLECSSFTINNFCYYSGMKYSTARDYLNSLCKGESPLLEKRKFGTSMLFSRYKEKEPEKT